VGLVTRVAAIILQNDGIVLIERKIYDERYYVFPGGSIEKGESFLCALKRELYEELGYKLFSSKLIIRYQRKYNTEYYFLVTTAGLKKILWSRD
jgi:8-oxo-dGTP pyrophosphatase MutT (NUDIX family)